MAENGAKNTDEILLGTRYFLLKIASSIENDILKYIEHLKDDPNAEKLIIKRINAKFDRVC